MYKLHKENPEVYTIERLAKDYRIMRQRVHAILWLKEMEEEEEKKLLEKLNAINIAEGVHLKVGHQGKTRGLWWLEVSEL
ncbi:hypothetical protein HPP92_014964 [Vanilla planifolia]|uniref:Uncharacterized protein n=1 Tax=Vanilla planifolia TaxID=51239 RepID=A0A835QVJ3_VANPL|nr:hypothetical protein HPP92_014964 [Vanilla planifolia]